MIVIKLINGRHYYDRLYKAGKLYNVSDEIGNVLLGKRHVNKKPIFKRMIPKTEVKKPVVVETPKRKPGRPKKSEKIENVVDETPVEEVTLIEQEVLAKPADLSDLILAEDMVDEFVEEDGVEVEAVETFDPAKEEQDFGDKI